MLGSNERDQGQYDRPAEHDALFGCALLIRREAWEQVGELWEPFFNYAEETDWCLRARRRGWKLRYIPDAVVWHRTSSSLGWNSPLKVYLITRNQFYLRRRHRRGGWRGLRGLCYALYVQGRTALRYIRRGQLLQAKATMLALWDVLLGRIGNSRTSRLRLRRQMAEVGTHE
jgi:GT2 family glycosyltransferase